MMGAVALARPRPFLKLWHRWFGLLAGIWLLLLAVTGCVITFYDELDTWLNPDWRSVTIEAGSTPVPLDLALKNAQAALPGFAPNMLQMPGDAGDSLWAIGHVPVDGIRVPVQIFIDPYDGTVLGWRESGKWALDRRHLMDLFYGLHIDLMAGPWMTWFFGLVSLFWLGDHLIAIALSFPKGARWWKSFRLSGGKGSLRRLYDLHRAQGLWLAPVTLILAFTGVTLTWQEESRHAAELVSHISHRLHEDMPETDEEFPAAITVEQAIDRAATAHPGRVHSIRLFQRQSLYAVRTFHPRDRDDQGRMWTYVRLTDGEIVGSRHDNGSSAGDEFFAWQYPLHSGKAFGLAGRLLVFAGGIATIMLCVTGIRLWLSRRRQRRPAVR